ncbi:unnamed protein product [Bursaphelenchus xylophilus]|uniref:(pine wood nematode) hypothetical protein n=1 Tax=Bursaphelenchus xylophilus TaxID=6326 RepID=A0A1I7S8S8_BURXY|nr:unnamed protein product [Bursaphelenchus xylophilus]CAG9085807.1 unnamed protein product [Bursaphelenchus xylophilus]
MFRIGGKSTLVPEVIKDGLSCSAFCQVQNGIGYVFGGFNKTGCHNLVYKINNGLVSRCPPLSTDLKNAAAVIARNNRAYIIGGWDGKRTLDTIFTYEDDKLLYETRLPYPVEGHSSSVFDEFIINVGGFDGVSVISTISIYDTITKRTLLVDAKLKTPRENHCTVIFKKDKKNVMLIMGGWDGQEALSECEAFELINESPFVIPIQWNCDLIEPRNRPAVVVVPTE